MSVGSQLRDLQQKVTAKGVLRREGAVIAVAEQNAFRNNDISIDKQPDNESNNFKTPSASFPWPPYTCVASYLSKNGLYKQVLLHKAFSLKIQCCGSVISRFEKLHQQLSVGMQLVCTYMQYLSLEWLDQQGHPHYCGAVLSCVFCVVFTAGSTTDSEYPRLRVVLISGTVP